MLHADNGASRREFTSEDDDFLAQYIAKYNPAEKGRRGNVLYQRLVENVRPVYLPVVQVAHFLARTARSGLGRRDILGTLGGIDMSITKNASIGELSLTLRKPA